MTCADHQGWHKTKEGPDQPGSLARPRYPTHARIFFDNFPYNFLSILEMFQFKIGKGKQVKDKNRFQSSIQITYNEVRWKTLIATVHLLSESLHSLE